MTRVRAQEREKARTSHVMHVVRYWMRILAAGDEEVHASPVYR